MTPTLPATSLDAIYHLPQHFFVVLLITPIWPVTSLDTIYHLRQQFCGIADDYHKQNFAEEVSYLGRWFILARHAGEGGGPSSLALHTHTHMYGIVLAFAG